MHFKIWVIYKKTLKSIFIKTLKYFRRIKYGSVRCKSKKNLLLIRFWSVQLIKFVIYQIIK